MATFRVLVTQPFYLLCLRGSPSSQWTAVTDRQSYNGWMGTHRLPRRTTEKNQIKGPEMWVTQHVSDLTPMLRESQCDTVAPESSLLVDKQDKLELLPFPPHLHFAL